MNDENSHETFKNDLDAILVKIKESGQEERFFEKLISSQKSGKDANEFRKVCLSYGMTDEMADKFWQLLEMLSQSMHDVEEFWHLVGFR